MRALPIQRFWPLHLLWLVPFALGCAGDGALPSDTGPEVEVRVAPLQLDGVSEAVWDLELVNGAGAPVWQARLTSSRFGDGGGSFTYVGPCDASAGANPNTVRLRLVGAWVEPVTLTSPHDAFEGPAPEGAVAIADPGLITHEVTCLPNTDHLVELDVMVLRPASQGFLDFAVSFNNIFCSAKFDCCDADDPSVGCAGDGSDDILLLFDETGERARTFVLGLTCALGVGGQGVLELYMDDLVLDCTGGGGANEDLVLAVAGERGGNQCVAGDLASCTAIHAPSTVAPDAVLFQLAHFRGATLTEGLGGAGYWNVALGVRDAIAGCHLRTRATANNAAYASGVALGAIAPGTVYPVITWDVPLGACGAEGLAFDDALAPVRTEYTASDGPGAAFDRIFFPLHACDDGVQNGLESDVDCGGPYCVACPGGATCGTDLDCATFLCLDGVCAPEGTVHYGTGRDGDLVVGSDEVFEVDAQSTSLIDLAPDARTLTVAEASGFEAGDELLILTAQALEVERAGTWALAYLHAVDADAQTLTLAQPLAEAFDPSDRVIVQRVPHYGDVTVAGTLTAAVWGGEVGGVVAFRATGELLVLEGGEVTADGIGFRGGTYGAFSGATRTGQQGESYLMVDRIRTRARNHGGGGGGGYSCSGSGDLGDGGGGGAYGTDGGNGGAGYSAHQRGDGGLAYGVANLAALFFGSGGGGGGSDFSTGGCGNSDRARGGHGARGGGLLFVAARQVINEGAMTANGAKGLDAIPELDGEGGGGGGGAGGSILLFIDAGDAGTLEALGGAGGLGTMNNQYTTGRFGGVGGDGRVVVTSSGP